MNPFLSSKMQTWVHLAVIYIILNSLGFPGLYTKMLGSSIGTVIEYSSFLLQLVIMLITSGDSLLDLKLINLKRKFFCVYFFVGVLFIQSMITTSARSSQFISCLRVTVTSLFALWLCENYKLGELLTLVFYAQFIYCLAAFAWHVVFSSIYGTSNALRAGVFLGLVGNKNSTAGELGFGVMMQVLLLHELLDDDQPVTFFFLGALAFQTVLLLWSQGTGALLNATTISFYVLLLPKLHAVRLPLGYIYIAGSIGFLVFALTIIPLFEPVFNALGKDATLTGRTVLWPQIIYVMSRNKTLLGYGYGMFWNDPKAVALVHAGFAENSFFGQMTAGSHNIILELWCNDGLVGVGAFYIALLMAFQKIRYISANRYVFSSAYLLLHMIRGWTERGWPTYEYNLLFLMIMFGMATVELDQLPKKKKKTTGRIRSQKTSEDLDATPEEGEEAPTPTRGRGRGTRGRSLRGTTGRRRGENLRNRRQRSPATRGRRRAPVDPPS